MKMGRLSYFLAVVLISIVSCHKKEDNTLMKVDAEVPAVYTDAQNGDFSKNQDTLFYNNNYFSGHAFHLYPNLDTAFDISFLNGVQEGVTKKWYPNGQAAEERWYIRGKKEGIHKAWWENGNPKFVFDVTDDAYCGELKEWYNTGQLAKDFHYVKGQEEGSQKLWWADGRMRANYVVRKGKKYGSIGVKLCLNPNDSIYKK